MKRKNKIYLRMTMLLVIVYFVLLTILCVPESADSSTTIRSFKDALWYSLVTFTTVGYGDLTPVTPVGQAVGVVHKKNTGSRCKIFFMKENDIGTNIRAVDLHSLPVDVYARTTNGQDRLSGNICFFHSYDCCAL